VTYAVSFTLSPTGGLVGGKGTVTVTAPVGTIFPSSAVTLDDLTTRPGSGSIAGPISGSGTNAVTYRVGADLRPGDLISLKIPGVVNPAVGAATLQVQTSSDTTAAASAGYSLVAPTPVTVLGLARTSQVASAAAVTWSTTATLSPTGDLVGAKGTITLNAPAGTVFTSSAATVNDLTTRSGSGLAGAPVAGVNTNVATYRVPAEIRPGDTITVVVPGVTNPAAAGGTLTVSTTSDAPGSIPVTQAWAPANPKVSLSSTAVGANHVQASTSFVVPGTGSLAAGTGTITLDAPAGSVFSDRDAHLVDSTTPSGTNDADLVSGQGGDVAVFRVRNNVAAGDTVTLVTDDMTNPTAASAVLKMSVTTSIGTTAALSDVYAVVAATPTSAPAVSLSSAATRASHVRASITFTASPTGALRGGLGTVTLVGPSGTVFPNLAAHLIDSTDGAGTSDIDLVSPPYSTSATYRVRNNVSAGDTVTVVVDDLPNRSTPSTTQTLSVSTSSNTTAAKSSPYTVVTRQALSQMTLSIDRPAAGASDATYLLAATTSSSGGLAAGQATITVTGPVGTIFFTGDATVYDPAARTTAGATYLGGAGTRSVTYRFTKDIRPGTRFILAMKSVTNGPTPTTTGALTAKTSSDSSGSATFTLTAKPQLGVTYYVTERNGAAIARIQLDANGNLYQDNRYFVSGLAGGGPDSALFDHQNRLLASNPDVGTISAHDAGTGAQLSPRVNNTLLSTVADMALDPQSDTVWTVGYGRSDAQAISKVNLTDGTTTFMNSSAIPSLGGIIFNASGSRLFVTSHSGAIDEISRADGHLIRSLVVPAGPDGMTYDSFTGDVFASGCGGLCEVGIGTDAAPVLTLVRSISQVSGDGITTDGQGNIAAASGNCCLKVLNLTSLAVTTIASNIPSADDVAPLVGNGAPALTIPTTALPGATVGSPYSAAVVANGGSTPYAWTVVSGALPAGLSLNGTSGAITGTPSASGTFSFTARVTDSSPTVQAVNRALTITVSP